MKPYYLLSSFLLCAAVCSAQTSSSPLNDISYYTAAANKATLQLQIAGDSVFLKESRGGREVGRECFGIVGRNNPLDKSSDKTPRDYLLYVCKALPPRQPSKWKLPPPRPYSLFVLRLSPDRQQLYVLHEDKPTFMTLEDAEKANSDLDPGNKYFATWYSPKAFAALIRQPALSTADRATLQKVVDLMVDGMQANLDKRRQTGMADYYGTWYMQDNLTKALITQHLSPITSLTEFSQKIAEYKLSVPRLPTMHTQSPNPPAADTSHLKAPTVHP
jgi:hypothetical protein